MAEFQVISDAVRRGGGGPWASWRGGGSEILGEILLECENGGMLDKEWETRKAISSLGDVTTNSSAQVT